MGTTAALCLHLVMVVAAAGLSSGEVHRVGGASGWSIVGNSNYTSWASSRNFHVGDSLVFVYNKQFHNVLEVSKEDFRACNAARPIAVYASGNDTVPVRRRGHTFFICGVPGHCELGEKVDIRVPKGPAAAAVPPPPAAGPAPAPAERGGGGGRLGPGWERLGVIVVATTLVAAT